MKLFHFNKDNKDLFGIAIFYKIKENLTEIKNFDSKVREKVFIFNKNLKIRIYYIEEKPYNLFG